MKDKVTIVTGIFDIGRDMLGASFKRPFQHYLDHFKNVLQLDYPMAVFIEAAYEDFVWQHRSPANTEVYIKDKTAFSDFPFFRQTEAIRQSDAWRSQATWLQESTQANLPFYNPLVMSKFFFLHDLTLLNPFQTDYFVWVDGALSHTVDIRSLENPTVKALLPELLEPFLFLCFPYIGGGEVHGFERKALAEYCHTDYVNRVARGGFFGGHKKTIQKLNSVYYNLLSGSLNRGLMGTEESIFTILSYQFEEALNHYMLESDGLVYRFFENLSAHQGKAKDFKKAYFLNQQSQDTALYVVSYNAPGQFQLLLSSLEQADPTMLSKTQKYLINNSIREDTLEAYAQLCERYGFEEFRNGNIGINGARQFAAEHFDGTEASHMIFFEDDMLLHGAASAGGRCTNGFPLYTENLLSRSLAIIKKENFDFLKLSFTEFYGSNATQWAWYNLPQDQRTHYFPENDCLPSEGLATNPPKTSFGEIGVLHGVPYISGDIYYCNWPHLISKEGNRKMFLETRWAHPYEQTWMSHFFLMTKDKTLRAGLLLASPVNHHRAYHYPAEERREN